MHRRLCHDADLEAFQYSCDRGEADGAIPDTVGPRHSMFVYRATEDRQRMDKKDCDALRVSIKHPRFDHVRT
jgi:hypothetical protein